MPTGTLTRKIQRHDRTARIRPPATGPTMLPTAHVIELMPIARPRSPRGKASVMIAMPLAISIAPPTPWTQAEEHQLGAVPGERTQQRPDREDPEPKVVHADPPEHVRQAPEEHQEDRAHEDVAHEHPDHGHEIGAQVGHDRGEPEHDDRGVDRCHSGPERGHRQGDPLVFDASAAPAVAAGPGRSRRRSARAVSQSLLTCGPRVHGHHHGRSGRRAGRLTSGFASRSWQTSRSPRSNPSRAAAM